MFEKLSVSDLTRIVAAGGGFTLSATNFTPADLTRIAAAAAQSAVPVIFSGVGDWKVDDIVKVAAAGQGYVSFAD